MPDSDFLIVGAGLVGQLLARSLAQRGKTVTLAHDPRKGGASRVAAWMINPITGIRFVVSWRVEEFLPAALALFREMERESGLKIWHPLPIVRMFQGEDEWPRWAKKRMQPAILRYVEEEFMGAPTVPNVSHTSGGIIFKDGGWADLGPWLRWNLEHLPPGIQSVSGRIERGDFGNGPLQYQGRTFSRVIFCTGYQPSNLPWKPAKGELLTVRIPGLKLVSILLRGIFVIPLGDDFYRVGATYEWEDLSDASTEKGVDFLRKKLAALVKLPFEIIDAQAAIRPILQDARPVMGLDKDDPRIGICNGFGSKAGLMAPYLVEQFADHLVNGAALDSEISLARLN